VRRQIFYKKQRFGKWRRDDGKSNVLISKEAMDIEIERLINEGWTVETHGITFLRAVTLTKF